MSTTDLRALLDPRTRRSSLLLDLVAAVASATTETDVLRAAARAASSWIGDVCTVYVFSEDRAWLDLAAAEASDPEVAASIRALAANHRAAAGEGIAGRVVATAAPYCSHGEQSDLLRRLKPEYRPLVKRLGLHSFVGVPLRIRAEIVGVLEVARYLSPEAYSNEDVTFLEGVATSTALAYDSLRSHRLTLKAAARSSGLLAASPLATLIVGRNLRIESWNKAAEDLFGWTESEMVGRDDLPGVPLELRAEAGEMRGRMMAGEAIRGQETVRTHKDGTPIDVAVFGAGADVGDGIAIHFVDLRERKRLGAQAREESERRTLLADFSLVTGNAPGSEIEALVALCQRTGEAIAGQCGVYELSQDRMEFELLATGGPAPRDGFKAMLGRQRWRADEGLMGLALATGETVFRPYLSADERDAYLGSLPEDRREEMARLDLRAMIALPLIVAGARAGVLTLARYGPAAEPLGERDCAFAEEIASRANLVLARLALAAERERAARDLRVRAEFLEGVVEADGDENGILERLASATATELGDICVIKLLTPDRATLELRAVGARDPALVEMAAAAFRDYPLPADTAIDLKVIADGVSVLTPVGADEIRLLAQPGYEAVFARDYGSLMVVPLRIGRRIAGDMLLLRCAKSGQYEPHDLSLVEDLARRAGVAIERHRAERARLETIARLDAVLTASPIPLILLDRDSRVMVWNPAAEALFGWNSDELVGQPLPMVPHHVELVMAEIGREALAGSKFAYREMRQLRRDGTEIPVALFQAPYRVGDGEIAGTVLGFIDLREPRRLEAEARREAESARLMAEFLETATRAGDDRVAVLQALAERAAGFGGGSCWIYLLSPARTQAKVVAYHWSDPVQLDLARSFIGNGRVRTDETTMSEVLRTGNCVFRPVIENVADVAFIEPKHRTFYERFPLHGLMAVPLRLRGEIIGAIAVGQVDPARARFDDRDLAALSALGDAASLLIERADAREQLEREAQRAETAAAFFASVALAGSEEEVQRSLVSYTLQALRGEAVYYSVSPDGEHIRLVDVEPAGSLLARNVALLADGELHPGEGVGGIVAATGSPYFVPRVGAEQAAAYLATLPPDLANRLADYLPASALGVPLRIHGRVVGVLVATRDSPAGGPFEQADLTFLSGVATRASLALEAVGIRREAQRSSERDRLGAEFFQAAAAAGDDAAAVVQILVEKLARLGGYAWVQELADDGGHVELRAWHVTDPKLRSAVKKIRQPARAPASEGSAGEILRTAQPIFRPRLVADPLLAFVGQRHRASAGALVQGVVIVPLRRAGRVVGSLGVGHVDQAFRGYDEGDLAFLKSLAGATSIVLDHAETRRARVAAAAELARTAGMLAAVFDATPLAIVALDADGKLAFWSRAAERLFGWTADEVMGRTPPHIGGDGEAVIADEWRRVRSGEDLRLDTTRLRKDGAEVEVVAHIVAMRDQAGKATGLLSVYEDVTGLKRLEAELIQAQKMETVGRLAGGVAHDFNNILTAIIGYSDIARTMAEEPELKQTLAVVRTAAERAAGLTQQLLAFSRRQMLRPDVVEVSEVVVGMEAILRRLIGEDIELIVAAMPDAGAIRVDRIQLEQVILNLAVNARDAMPQGGRLVLTADRAVTDAQTGHVEMAAGEYVVISVSDTGTGMDEETKSHIFEPFFTTKEVGKGTGLGLATTYGIVRQSGGYVWVYSEIGRGSTFRIYFPRIGGAVPAEIEPPATTGTRRGRIMIVEDEPTLRDLARRILSQRGFEVVVAQDPTAAIEAAPKCDELDLLVTDVVMPGMTGIELARQLTEQRPGLRVLFMSGYSPEVVDQGGTTPRLFLAKPFTPDDLLRAVDEALAPPDDTR